MVDFKRSLAVVIGINEYQDYPKLQTARYDAEQLAEILVREQNYDYVILVTDDTYKEYRQGQELSVKNKFQPTLNGLLNLLGKRLPSEINPTKEDRLLFYFAGHGIPDDSDEGPKGYLVPLDADSKKRDSLLPMQELYKYLAALNCRHFLIILDCCFAGRFRWESTRKGRTFPKVIHQEHYDRFIKFPAWQAITSASHDQEAFDILGDNRGMVEGTNHSPFAEGLFEALKGAADRLTTSKNGQPAGDGVITATELYLYLRDRVEIGSKERQTPGLWSLPKHDRGEYIFLVPGAEKKLKPAPKVNEKNNPYRGLESFDEEHSRFFFGREGLIEQLSERISAPKQPLTVVLGRSGSGKSSLVKAGLIPCLKKLSKSEVFEVNQWHILNPMRPGESPFTALVKTILPLADITGSNQSDTLNFINVSKNLNTLTFITEILKEKVSELDKNLAESSSENGEESSETLRLKKEVEKFKSITEGWYQGTQKAKQLLIVEHFEELYTLCGNPAEQQQLQQAVSDCLDPLSLRLQSDPNQLINIVTAWSQKNPGVKLLLTIDQFEELVTLSQSKQKDKQNSQQQQQKKLSNQPTQEVQQENKQEEWQQFLNLLEKTLSANLEQLRIIVTLRSDFEPRFLNSDALKSYWTKARFPVRAMRSDELRQAIERPAAEIALYFEPPNLVDKLIDEVGQMPGALPLLSFTLSEQYKKLAEKWRIQETSDRALTLDADFDTEGGVAGSLTRRANQEYDGFPDDAHRATLRRVMLRMVTTEGGELARRRVPLSELVYADAVENERVKLVLEQFDRARLIVSGQETGEPYVEPAHDFLVRSWDKLQKWQQEEQEDLLLQRRLTPVAIEWKSKEQLSSLLGKTEPVLDWCDKRIDSVEDWLKNKIKKNDQQSQREKKRQFLWNGNPYLDVLKRRLKSYDPWFNQVESEFVQKSVWQRRRNTNLRWVIAILVGLGLIGLTFWALVGVRDTQIQQISKLRQSTEVKRQSNQELEALLDVLKVGKLLDNWLLRLFKPDAEIEQLRRTLSKIVYTVQEVNRLEGHRGPVMAVDFQSTPNGEMIVTKGIEGVAVWHLDGRLEKRYTAEEFQDILKQSDGNLYKTLEQKSLLPVLNFSPDGKMLAHFDDKRKGTVTLWNSDGSLHKTFQAHSAHNGQIMTVRFSPDSQMIATGSWEYEAKLWKLDGTLYKTLKGHNSAVNALDFSRDGQIIASGSNDRTVKLWNRDGTLLKNLEGHKGEVWGVSISPDSQMIASASNDGTVKLWNRDGTLLKTLEGHRNTVRAVRFSADGHILASASDDGTVKLWRLGSAPLTILDDYTDPVYTVRFNPDGKTIATTTGHGHVKLWQRDGTLLKFERWQYGSITALEFSPDGKLIVSGAGDRTVRLSRADGSTIKLLPGHTAYEKSPKEVLAVSFSPDSQIFALGDVDGKIELWNRDGSLKQTLLGHKATVRGLSFSPDGQMIASASADGTVKLWNRDGSLEQTLSGHGSQLLGVAFSPDKQPDDQIIAAASADETVKLWKRDGTELKPLVGHSKVVRAVAFSPNGQLIATASYDKTVKLWKKDGTLLKTFYGHNDRVNAVAFSPDGKRLASASNDKTVNLWNLEDLDLNVGGLRKYTCNWMRDYLKNNPNVSESDRHLCDDVFNEKADAQNFQNPGTPPTSGGRFIVNLLSGKCIDVLGETSGLNLGNGLPSNQKWTLGSDGFIRNRSSGKCIDVGGAPGDTNGAPLVLWDCETSRLNRDNSSPSNQKWTLGSDGFIRNRSSGKCIDVGGAPGDTNGAPLVLWDCETSGLNRDNSSPTDQRWGLQ
jgi:WD40 repeat protein